MHLGSRHPSLQLKVFGLVAFVVLGLVGGMVAMFPRQRIGLLRSSLENRATTYTHILSSELEPAVAFDDRETARESLDTIKADPDVLGAAVYGDDGSFLAGQGTLSEPTGGPAPKLDPLTMRLENTADELRATAPIVAREGERGVLVIVLSKSSIARGRVEVYRTTAGMAAVALALGLVSAFLIARGISRRLAAITDVARSVAEGDFDRPALRDPSRDEVGQLAIAFDAMKERIRDLLDERYKAAREEHDRLERLVKERTVDLAKRNDAMGLVLDNLSEGILTLAADGVMGIERSRVLDRWFGIPKQRQRFVDYLREVAPDFASRFELGWESVIDDMLPCELALDQLPSRLTVQGRTYLVRVSQVQETEGQSDRAFLVVVTDFTASLLHEQEEAAHRDLAAALRQISTDRAGFSDFVQEAQRQARQVCSKALVDAELRRDLHTLKGNCAMVGLRGISTLCHEMETFIESSGDVPPAASRAALEMRIAHVASAVGEAPNDRLEIDRTDHARLLKALEGGASRGELAAFVRSLELEPAGRQLGRLAQHVRALAERCDKEIEVTVDDGGVRLDPSRFVPFFSSLVHAARNAVVHGIESSDERIDEGKPARGLVALRARVREGSVVVEITDDGRGISWDRLAQQATAKGLRSIDRADLEAALTSGGLSTAAAIDDLAGRGEGVGALRQATESLGGTLVIESSPGRGTSFACSFPIDLAVASPLALVA